MKTFNDLVTEIGNITAEYVEVQIENSSQFIKIMSEDPKLAHLYQSAMTKIGEAVGGRNDICRSK